MLTPRDRLATDKVKERSFCGISERRICRRDFLAAGLVVSASCFFPLRAVASVTEVFPLEKELSFYNTHTGESTTAVYWRQGAYLPHAMVDINYILRDFRTGEVKEIDPDLLNLLFALRHKLESTGPFHIISGYRSVETNLLLGARSNGVANNSLHIKGKAIDIRLPGYELQNLHRAAVSLRGGGVGYYPGSDFVHVDVGKIRYW